MNLIDLIESENKKLERKSINMIEDQRVTVNKINPKGEEKEIGPIKGQSGKHKDKK